MKYRLSRYAIMLGIAFPLLAHQELYAFENTKVLPKGVRNVNVRTLYTQSSTKTDRNGDVEPLAEPLWRPLRFRNVLSGETGLKRQQLEGLMLQQGWNEETSLGDFHAQLNAQINVWAPIIAYGITDRITLAVAAPVYNASTDIQGGFTANQGAQNLISALTDPTMNNTQSGIEVAEKLQNAISRLNDKLVDNNFEPLNKWNHTGLGDITVVAKMLVLDGDFLKGATSLGFNAPTGKVDSPDIMTDLPFGEGQWDLFGQLTFDQVLFSGITLNEFVKYTYQAPGERDIRLKTYEETIEVPKEDTRFKLGDKLEAGTSLQFEQSSTGLIAGLGMQYFRKYSDRYETDLPLVKQELQRDTAQNAFYWQARIGYTSLPAFQRKEFAVPLIASIEYRQQYESRNSPRTNFTQLDIGIFF
ncbi:MAG: hypothetical protein ACOH5I_04205 [Oligoflexus sp.]